MFPLEIKIIAINFKRLMIDIMMYIPTSASILSLQYLFFTELR